MTGEVELCALQHVVEYSAHRVQSAGAPPGLERPGVSGCLQPAGSVLAACWQPGGLQSS